MRTNSLTAFADKDIPILIPCSTAWKTLQPFRLQRKNIFHLYYYLWLQKILKMQ